MDRREIDREISVLESAETNYSNCQKLSILYIIRNNMTQKEPQARMVVDTGSEFLSVSTSKDPHQVLQILDEHMDCIKALYPTEYSVLIKRIKSL